MTPDHDRAGLRPGLPAFLSNEPERLNNLLGLNREQRRRIMGLVPRTVRSAFKAELDDEPESAAPGELDRRLVAWQYEDPDFRRMLWEHRLREGPGKAASLEFLVLRDFVEPAPDDQEHGSGAASDRRTRTGRIAEKAWSHTRERLAEWDYLGEEARATCIVRAFAVATLRDDPEILTEAVQMVPVLENQFGHLLGEETHIPLPDDESELAREWVDHCETLSELADQAAGPPPDPALLDEIAAAVEALQDMGPQVEAEAKAQAVEDFVESVRSTLNELRADDSFAWLDKKTQAALMDRWNAHAASLTVEQMDGEWERIDARAKQAEEAVREAFDAATVSEQRVLKARSERPRSIFERRAWAASLAELQAEEHAAEVALADAQVALLTVFSPGGEPYGLPPEDAAPSDGGPAEEATEAEPAEGDPG